MCTHSTWPNGTVHTCTPAARFRNACHLQLGEGADNIIPGSESDYFTQLTIAGGGHVMLRAGQIGGITWTELMDGRLVSARCSSCVVTVHVYKLSKAGKQGLQRRALPRGASTATVTKAVLGPPAWVCQNQVLRFASSGHGNQVESGDELSINLSHNAQEQQ